MIDQGSDQMAPLYGAMSVCSSTIAWLEAQERERSDWELHLQLSKLGSSIQDFLNCRPNISAPGPSAQAIEFTVCCLAVVTTLTTRIIQKVRSDLPNASERFRQPIAFLVNQLDEMVD